MSTLTPGQVFHRRYEIVRCIRAGGMGAIYEVVHLETRRRRALKVMLPDIVGSGDMLDRFRLEATIAANIESEHIVETFDAGVDEDTGAPFLVMELLRGEDLRTTLRQRGTLAAAEVVALFAQVASALQRTHAAGVIHRDLKPDNLFLTRRDDGSPKIKILDFGIAKVLAEGNQAAARTRIMGTPLYMSPEQVRGDGTVGPRADLYALGHIAFTLLVGSAYWADLARQGDVYALMLQVAGGGGPAASEMASRRGVALPLGFDAWFARCTAIDPHQRFETATALVGDLAAVLGVPAAGLSNALLAPVPHATASVPPYAAAPPMATSLLPDVSAFATPSAPSLSGAAFTEPRPRAARLDSSASSLSSTGTGGERRPPTSKLRIALPLAALAILITGGLAIRFSTGGAHRSFNEDPKPAAMPPSPPIEAPPAPNPSMPVVSPDIDAGIPSIADAGALAVDAGNTPSSGEVPSAHSPILAKPRPMKNPPRASASAPAPQIPPELLPRE
ncbi:Putative serine/threonine-protein kinase pknH [Minicystis rosea]|nr:Putative serine/threonine-protein kinase pknH [Minicystis rosea]